MIEKPSSVKSPDLGLIKQFGAVIKGRTIYTIVNWIYDNPLYIAVIAKYGPVIGGAIMTAGSLAICMGLLLHYRKKNVSWLGWDAIDILKERESHYTDKINSWRQRSTFIGRIISSVFALPAYSLMVVLRSLKIQYFGDAVAFVFLSIFEDPFIVTAYLRHGKHDGLRKKDWAVFFASVLVSNGYWIARNTIILSVLLRPAWNFIID